MKSSMRLKPLPLRDVTIRDRFWAPRLTTNRTVSLPLIYRQWKRTGRIDAWKLDWKPGMPKEPHRFWDSDVAKWIEAAAYCLATDGDPRLERRVDRLIDLVAGAQRPDGYLNPHYTVVEPDRRWIDLIRPPMHSHELYCAGHLIEAAVAYYEATGKRRLLDVVCRYADLIDNVFGPRKGQKRWYPGHEEIELALVRLYRATGHARYLTLAKFFVDARGRRPHFFRIEPQGQTEGPPWEWRLPTTSLDQAQAHLPVREQTTADGHAVRAMYLFSGMADIAAETDDRSLATACKRLWKNVTERRMYVTGGVGSAAGGERFTTDYDLPNEAAYCETCAGVGLVFWAHRMLHLTGDARYADVMERCLYNGTISGVALDGERFFYRNELEGHGRRVPEDFNGVSCCPANIARLLASFGRYVCSQSRNAVFVHLFVQGSAQLIVRGQPVEIVQKTDYPWKEEIRVIVRPAEPIRFTLALRIPDWCRRATLKLNGKSLGRKPRIGKGYLKIRRTWRAGDTVDLRLPMPVERIEAHPRMRANCGRVALQRGPIVYCLEDVDNGPNLNAVLLPRRSGLRAGFDRRLLGGVVAITGRAERRDPSAWNARLYRPDHSRTVPTAIKAIPYYAWGNRKPGEMLVWIRQR